jgi:hypothetical protein
MRTPKKIKRNVLKEFLIVNIDLPPHYGIVTWHFRQTLPPEAPLILSFMLDQFLGWGLIANP